MNLEQAVVSIPPRSPAKLKRWQVVELINWCRDHEGEDEEQDFTFEVCERGSNEIAITVALSAAATTLVVDWTSGKAKVERSSMTRSQALRIWTEILSEALDGKIEKAQHRGYFNCRICNETIYLTGTIDIWTHLTGHDVKVEKITVGEGISVQVGKEARELDQFLVGEDAPIH